MKYQSIQWEGGMFTPETLEKLADESTPGQAKGDFGLSGKVKDEISQAWADAKATWAMFRLRAERDDPKDKYGTSRVRQFWVQPLLALLGFDLQNASAVEAGGKSFTISHRSEGRICPVHIVGFTESLDKKREGQKTSPHSLVQEYLNLEEAVLYALVTNGLQLRLLRDSSRLVKLSYLEFNLERIFTEELFADFALLFRLLHASRWSQAGQEPHNCLLERYHQDSLEDGSRIREKLSVAVKEAMEHWATGFLNHPANDTFRRDWLIGEWTPRQLYDDLLTLVYRSLFLLVIEERDLVFGPDAEAAKRNIYYDHYSLQSLRTRIRGLRTDESRHYDLWEGLKDCFRLFEDEDYAARLGMKPLAVDLFSPEALALLKPLRLDNRSFAQGLALLDAYWDDERGVSVRVNYASLNVEEFGSVYEGLLDFDAVVAERGSGLTFAFQAGDDRGRSGSHYTPEELVQPLIEHALEPRIDVALRAADPEAALLKLRVCDDACGSGHILLNAARRIALELARLRTGADNPDPDSYRHALRQVISRCIYGVDSNPQAVRLCKVALWLESHHPGESLGFLDNHIKCGDSLVGVARPSDLLAGIPEAAFTALDRDDKEHGAELRKRHKKERAEASAKAQGFQWQTSVGDDLSAVIRTLQAVAAMPDTTPQQAQLKKDSYLHVVEGSAWHHLRDLANAQLAPFFLPKQPGVAVATEGLYRRLLSGEASGNDEAVYAPAEKVAGEQRFFHWFLEFAEVMQEGGFDCFLGNPPFLGGQRLSGTFGKDYLEYLKTAYAPAGSIDLVGYFVRRNFDLLKPSCALGTLATNTLAQGATREGSLQVIEQAGGTIAMAVKSMPWPGAGANVSVSMAAICKGQVSGYRMLDGRKVAYISTYFDDQQAIGNPYPLAANADQSFQGSIVLGQGFVLSPEEAQALIARDPRNKDVLFPYLNGEDLNSRPDQSPSRWVINFKDWPLDRASAPPDYPADAPVAADFPDCLEIVERLVKPERAKGNRAQRVNYWWQFAERAPRLYRTIAPLERVMVTPEVTKFLSFSQMSTNAVFSHMTKIIAVESDVVHSMINSSFHSDWSWKYCSTMGGATLRYTPSSAFETFPFPQLPPESEILLNQLGQELDESRRSIMQDLQIGLTKLYNLMHQEGIQLQTILDLMERNPQTGAASPEPAAAFIDRIQALRDLHRRIDLAVRNAYGWSDLPLDHGFHDLDFLPENDRRRYTISPIARKEVLRRLLELNHARHAEELAAGLVDENGKVIKKKESAVKVVKPKNAKASDVGQGGLF